MRPALPTLLLLAIMVALSALIVPSSAATPQTVCGVATDRFLSDFAARELPGETPISIRLLAINDIMCNADMGDGVIANMGNVVVAVQTAPGKRFGIFHLHFGTDASFQSAAAFLKNVWLPKKGKNWREAWCVEVIAPVYPSELKAEGCEK